MAAQAQPKNGTVWKAGAAITTIIMAIIGALWVLSLTAYAKTNANAAQIARCEAEQEGAEKRLDRMDGKLDRILERLSK